MSNGVDARGADLLCEERMCSQVTNHHEVGLHPEQSSSAGLKTKENSPQCS